MYNCIKSAHKKWGKNINKQIFYGIKNIHGIKEQFVRAKVYGILWVTTDFNVAKANAGYQGKILEISHNKIKGIPMKKVSDNNNDSYYMLFNPEITIKTIINSRDNSIEYMNHSKSSVVLGLNRCNIISLYDITDKYLELQEYFPKFFLAKLFAKIGNKNTNKQKIFQNLNCMEVSLNNHETTTHIISDTLEKLRKKRVIYIFLFVSV